MRKAEFKRKHFEEYTQSEYRSQFLFHEKTTYIHRDTYLLLPLLCCDSISLYLTIQSTSIRQKENSPRIITADYLLNGWLCKRLNRTATHHYGVEFVWWLTVVLCSPQCDMSQCKTSFSSLPKSPMSLVKCCDVEKLYRGSERMVAIHEYYNTLHIDETLRCSAPRKRSQVENRYLTPDSSSHSI